MKKMVMGIFVVACAVVMTGCGSEETKTLNCTRTATITTSVSGDFSYTATYQGDDVQTLKTVEKVKSSDSKYLDTYKTTVETLYAPYKNIEHYNYKVIKDGDVVTSTTDIDYSKVDTDKLIKVDSANGQLIRKGKVSIKDLKSIYESLGATCKEK